MCVCVCVCVCVCGGRVCSENQALSDSLAQRGAELQALRSENYSEYDSVKLSFGSRFG